MRLINMGNGAAFAAPFPMLICSQERPWYSLRMISSISSGVSWHPPASHFFTTALKPLLKNSM